MKTSAGTVRSGVRGIWIYVALTALLMLVALMLLVLYSRQGGERAVAAVGLNPAGGGYVLPEGAPAQTYLAAGHAVRVEATGVLLLDGYGGERDYFLYDFRDPLVLQTEPALIVADRAGRDLAVLEPGGRFTGITGTTNAVASDYRDGILLVLGEDSQRRVVLTRYDLPEAKEIFELRPDENEVVIKAALSPGRAFIDVLCYDRASLGLKHVVRRYEADGTFVRHYDVGDDALYAGLVHIGSDLAVLGAGGVVRIDGDDASRRQYRLANARGLWNTGERLVALADGDDGAATLFLLGDTAEPIYRFKTAPDARPAAAGGLVAVVDGGELVLLDAGGGEPLSTYEIGEPVEQLALTESNRLIVLTGTRLLPFTLR